MIIGKIKKVVSIVAIFAILSTVIFSSNVLAGTPKEMQNNDKKLHATGLKEPTKEDLDWMKENMIEVKDVLPNDIGLKRANEVRKKKGLKELEKVKAVPKGKEVIPTSSSSTRANKAMNSIKSDSSSLITNAEVLSSTSLPSYVDNSKLQYFPPIRDQGSIGSCASFSTTYYQATYMTALARGWNVKDNNDNSNKFSPKWTYNLINGGEDGGSTPQSAYKLFLESGIATWADFPYSDDGSIPKNYLEWSTDQRVWRNAINYKMDKAGYVKVIDGTDTPVKSPDSPALENIKQLLNNGYILTYSTGVGSWEYKTIKDDPSTDTDNEFAGKSAAFIQEVCNGGHQMTVVGYNDNIWVDINDNNIVDPGEKGAFRIANSWGNDWGDNGFMWIAYDALNKVSAVSGAPVSENQRYSIWGNENIAYWITAKSSYTPRLVGEITLNHAKRNQLKLELGMEDAGTSGINISPIAVNYSSDMECAFDGTSTPSDATFVFDYSDMFKGKDISGSTKNWTIKVADKTLDGSGALVKSFKVVDSLSGNTAVCSQVYQNIDGGSMKFSAPLALSSNTIGSEWVLKNSVPFEMRVDKTYKFNDKIYAVGYSSDRGCYGLICYDPILDQTTWIRSVNLDSWDLSVGYNNKIYLLGKSNVKVYDINTGSTSIKSEMPGTSNASIVELGGKIYIINGYARNSSGNMTLSKGVKVYDPDSDTWSAAADTNIGRHAAKTCVLNGKIYLFGGYDSAWNAIEKMEVYDPSVNQWTVINGSLQCPVDSKLIALGNKIYTFGTDNLNQVLEYDPALNQWNRHNSIPEAYSTFMVEGINGKIYLLGGRYIYSSDCSKNILEFTPSLSSVSAPTFSPAGGTYTSIQTVTLASATEGATIRYTTDGTLPRSTSPIYTGPITVAGSKIIKAYAQKDGMLDSNVSGAEYTLSIKAGDVDGDGSVNVFDYALLQKYARGMINDFPVEDDLWAGDLDGDGLINDADASLMNQYLLRKISFFPKEQPSAPTFSPAGGTYTSIQTVALSCATKGVTIKYTTDGTLPTSTSPIYTGPITVAGSKTIKACAQKQGLPDSNVSSAEYTLSIKVGDVDGDGDITAFDYALLQKYARGMINGFPVEDDLWAGDLDGDGLINNVDTSLMKQYIFGQISFFPKQQVKAPTFTPQGGTYTSPQTVTLTSATEGANIRYTTDGTTPTSTSTLYTGAITVSDSQTIKAAAFKSGMVDSDIASASYTISQ